MTIRDDILTSSREIRDMKLNASDIDMLRSIEGAASFSAFTTARADWATYRQELRDYPSSIPNPLEDDLSNLPPMPLSPDEASASSSAQADRDAEAIAAQEAIEE